ncbi:MAG: hypothetical protein DHS20C08_17770 [Rhodomicrobium sp.]|jgi:hypothetical protein|nr:MAG: hypothetical protein DHS20C08_17770 [Rhodomicrobium sp.]
MSRPLHINPVEWELALSMARSVCAGLFKKGSSAEDAFRLYGGRSEAGSFANWQSAIEAIAYAHCQQSGKRAA